MIVYCPDENCIHNKDGICEHTIDAEKPFEFIHDKEKYTTENGKALELIMDVGGTVFCYGQEHEKDYE